MAFSYILLAIAMVAGLGLRLDDTAGVGARARDPVIDSVTWAEGELKRVYES